jgi:N-acetylglutamate synthase
VNPDQIRISEELSFNAWPSLQTNFYDGWLIRFANGFTRRANSVNPLYGTSLPVLEKIASCEAYYAAQDLPTVFKLTPATQPANLDNILVERGYELDAQTSVQVSNLNALPAITLPESEIELKPSASDAWMKTYMHYVGRSPEHFDTLHTMLKNISGLACYALIKINGETVSLGLGVLERGWIGLLNIVTAEAYRNQGYAMQMILHILQWGKHNGATKGYLQVMCNNAPALRLYEKLGYIEQYQYWYRVKE